MQTICGSLISMFAVESNEDENCATASHKFETPPEMLISRLSFSHIREIMSIDDPFERFFYELECIKGIWSVHELRRQIDSKLFFRAGISKKPELLLDKIESGDYQTVLSVKNVYALEFLGLDGRDEVTESDLEQAIMDQFLDGKYLRELFWSLARFKKPTHQISFHTKAALDMIRFSRAEEVYEKK